MVGVVAGLTRSYYFGVSELAPELVEETRRIVVAAMESVPARFAVPLKVKTQTGRTWVDCK